MNSQSFNSKKYALAFFMSTCLLTSSFLSIEARAASIPGANFSDLVRQVPKWKGQTVSWGLYPAEKKQEEWRNNGLVPSFYQAAQDLGITSYNAKNLEDTNKSTRDRAKRDKVRIELYIQEIEEQDFVKNKEILIKQNKLPTFEEAIQDLAIDYDPKRITDKSQKVRHIEKEKKAKIDTYITQVKGVIMNNKKKEYINKKKEYISNNSLPTPEELIRDFGLSKGEAKVFIGQINSETSNAAVNSKTEPEKCNAFLSAIRSLSSSKRTQQRPNSSTTSSNRIKRITEIVNNNSTPELDDSTRTPSQVPVKPNKLKSTNNTFDFKGSMRSLLNNKPEEELNNTEQKLKQRIELEEHKEEFKEILAKNPIDALQFAEQRNLDNSFKHEAIANIDLSKNIEKILFTVDDKGNRTILNTILTTIPERKDELIKQAQHHAIQTLPTSISKDVSDKKKLTLATLAATEDKKVLEAALDNWLSNNGYKRKPEVDSLISILLSDEATLKARIDKIFELPVENNVSNNQNKGQNGTLVPPPPPLPNGGMPPPPIPPLNGTTTSTPFNGQNSNHKFDLKNFEATYPRLYESYNTFIQNKTLASQPTPTSNNEPDTKAKMGESLELLKQKVAKQNEVIGLIRNEVTKLYNFDPNDPKVFVSLFGAETEEVTKQIDQNLQIKKILEDNSIPMTDTFKSKIFNESFEEAQQRLSSSNIIDEEQKKEIQQYIRIQEYSTDLSRILHPIEQLRFAYQHINILGQNTFNGKLNELVADSSKLTTSQKINFLLYGHKKLTEEIPLAKADLDKLKQNILRQIEIQQLIANKEISTKDLLNIINDKNPELLKSLLAAKVISEENKLNNSANEVDLKGVMPSLNYLDSEQLTTLINRVTIDGIQAALKDKWVEESKATANNTQTPPVNNNGIPIPPPISNGNSNVRANDYLIKNGVSQDLIDRINKLPKSNFSFNKKSTGNTVKVEDFISNVGKNYYKFTSELRGTDILLSNSQKLENAIKKEVLAKYIEKPNREIQDDSLLKQAFEEKFHYDEDIITKVIPKPSEINFDPNFIGPRTEIGQEIYELYEQELIKLARDPVFIEYVKNNNDTQKDERELLISFIEQIESKRPELEQKYGSEVQAENKNKKESLVEKMKKRFQKENEDNNDDSSTEDDIKQDSDKELDPSDLKTVLSTGLSNSNDSENDKSSDDKKSLPALRSSDEEDEGYKTGDEEELEESSTATEEEFKKDMLSENADEAIDILLETEEAAEQDEATQRQQLSDGASRKAALLNATSTLHKPIHSNILTDRLKVAAIGAGDEEASINRGVWISGLYGINKQGAWKNIPKYQSRTTGVTIGADAEFVNSHDVIGIAYSRLESHVKYNKKLGKTAINGHLLSIYGLKELIKGFSLQAITSYGHNYIKNKTTSINNIIGKYQNNNASFETLLNYKYRTKYDLHFIPSIGFKYDYSRASNYKEYEVDIENLMIQKKSNQSFESSLGGKIVFKPITTISNIVLTPSLHGNIEHHFYNKNTKVNAKATFKGQTLQETIILPKQPKLGYNIGSNILMSRKNINVLLEYNYYTHKKYQSHQGLLKLKVNL